MNKYDVVKEYFINNNIPLISNRPRKGKPNIDYIKMAVEGAPAVDADAKTITYFSKKYFPQKPKFMSLWNYILDLSELSYCSSCKKIKRVQDFTSNIDELTGVEPTCKKCKKARSNLYRASKLQRTIFEDELDQIKEFYANCPEGYHVDHIVPLQGKNVSGLHVLANLQYLTAEENMKKGNRFCSDSLTEKYSTDN